MMYSLWPLDKVQTAIILLEESISRGVTSVSNPAQGGVAYQSVDEAKKILADLYNRYLQLTGKLTGKKAKLGKPRIYALKRMEEY